MKITHTLARNTIIFTLEGELDQHTSASVREAMETEWEKKLVSQVILNMQNVTFMDSSGLGVILGRYKQINNANGKFVICCVNRQVEKVVELSGLKEIIDFYDTELAALQALGEE